METRERSHKSDHQLEEKRFGEKVRNCDASVRIEKQSVGSPSGLVRASFTRLSR